MRLVILLIFTSINLSASDQFLLSLAALKGESNYEIWQNSTSLRSKLIFPLDATLLNIEYKKKSKKNLFFTISYKTNIDSYKSIGEDYDINEKGVTVYSHSKNNLDYYDEISIESIFQKKSIIYSVAFAYKRLGFYWTNTFQSDFIKNKEYIILDRTIEYNQEFFLLAFSPKYSMTFSNLELCLSPSIFYGVNFSKDRHIKRDFYTKTRYSDIGYSSNIKLNYNISPLFSITLNYDYFSFKDNKSKTDYFDENNLKYLSLPSSMKYDENSIGIGFKHVF